LQQITLPAIGNRTSVIYPVFQGKFFPLGILMPFLSRPWHILLISLAGWIDRRQQETIQYLQTENHILKQRLGKKRICLGTAQRRRLAIGPAAALPRPRPGTIPISPGRRAALGPA
jgi:hypothetical protein